MKPGELEREHPLGPGRKHVAVIGSGISGLAVAWLLRDTHQVTLYEAAGRLGGHTNTLEVAVDGQTFPVDTGFLVFNRRTYPNLCALFKLLGIEAVASEMTFSARIESLNLEWAGNNLNTVFGQRRNLLRPSFIGMVRDIMRFNRETTALAAQGAQAAESLGDFLERRRYGKAFRDWYLLPMAAAIWSCPTETMLAYPLATFVRFCHNHGLLQLVNRPQWLTVKGGGREYVRRMASDLDDVRLNSPVLAVRRADDGIHVMAADGSARYDEVVFACHSDQALAILADQASPAERSVLSAVKYQSNRAVLHTDASLLPQRRSLWAAWNYAAGPETSGSAPVAVSYLINRLQPLPVQTPVIVSLNPFREPAPKSVIADIDYAHPVFDQAAIEAQRRLPGINGRDRLWFCGAWGRYGFHEDGLRSALAVVQGMGVAAPWQQTTGVTAA
ncbi:MAG: FAD-dependent oxidoreductase [Rhodocyclaceae bacterium]|nr:FAD-dependent oxidoreductase [Rhodocyclaceae bacterium]